MKKNNGIRFYYINGVSPTNITTSFYPGFMTDWQGPWLILMTQGKVFLLFMRQFTRIDLAMWENLGKWELRLSSFPQSLETKEFYNFNFEDNKPEYKHAARIYGPLIFTMRQLIFRICGLGQRLFSSACGKWGKCGFGVEHLDRGYEDFDRRIKKLGGNIKRVNE